MSVHKQAQTALQGMIERNVRRLTLKMVIAHWTASQAGGPPPSWTQALKDFAAYAVMRDVRTVERWLAGQAPISGAVWRWVETYSSHWFSNSNETEEGERADASDPGS